MSLLRRRLMMQADTRYIHFEDPEVERICLENWDKDGDGRLSKEEAGHINHLHDLTFIKITRPFDFTEAQYFTNLQRVDIINSKIRRIVFPDGMTEGSLFNCDSVEYADYPKTYTVKRNADWSWYGSNAARRILVLRSPVKVGNLNGDNLATDIYVPDDIVNDYTRDVFFKTKKIHPLSSLGQDYRIKTDS